MKRAILAVAAVALLLPNGAEAQPQVNGANDPNPAFAAMRYRSIGPVRGGRVTAVTGTQQHPGTFYFGSTGGGVWRTTDYGQSWENLSDNYFATASIGAIDVADTNPSVIYVGTGSAAIRSNVIIGKGVYKSTDAGKTWSHVGLEKVGQINTLIVHPTNPDIVWLAALGNPFAKNPERGVYRTKDGGRNWQRVLFLSDSVGASDLAINPSNPNEIYAGMWRGERKPWTIISGAMQGGVYKSSDGGETWTELTAGLPKGVTGKISVDVAASNPRIVYALIEAIGDENGVYRSDDAGATWRHVSNQAGLLNRPFYYTYIYADPKNPEKVWVHNEGYYLSEDGGRTWQRRSTPHGDNHGMWINPNDPDLYIQANDGGVNVTRDGGRTWSTQNNQNTAEIYQVAVDNRFPYNVYGAQQDNTTVIQPSTGGAFNADGPGCETGPIVPHPVNQDTVYGACKGVFSRMNMKTGQEKNYAVGASNLYGHNPKDLENRFQRVSPLVISPHDPNVIYHASQYVYRTRDEGVTWERISPDLTWNPSHGQVNSGSPITRDITGEEYYSTLYTVAESKVEKGVIWTGSNDGLIHVTRDDGKSWKNVTPKGLPAGGRVQTVEPSPHKAGKAYATVLLYMLDDWRPHVYRTTDYGANWTLINKGLPADHPMRVVREDPEREGLLYLGGEFGMFISHDDGANWRPFQQNLPVTPITDMLVHRGDLVLSTMGRGFWILDDLTPARQWKADVANAPVLLKPRPVQRIRGRLGTLPTGAGIDYYLPANASGVKLEILDAKGTVVRSYEGSRAPAGAPTAEDQGMRGPRMGQAAARLTMNPGHNRFYWDYSTTIEGRPAPIAVPGNYTVRLTANGSTQTQPLSVAMDARVAADGVTIADLQEQYDFTVKVQQLGAEARGTLQQVRTQLDAAQKASNNSRTAALEKLQSKLTQQTGIRYPQPMLIEQINYLNGVIGRADQKIGNDAKVEYEQLSKELASIRQELASLR